MYRLIIILLLSSLTIPVFASRTVTTQTPYYIPNYDAYYGGNYVPRRRYAKYNSSAFPDINDLERYAMNKNFSRDSDRIRLERLEMQAFGAVQQGDMYTRYDNVREALLTRPKQNYKTSLLRTIGNYFNGQLTGYTPSLSSDTNSFPFNTYNQSSTTEYITPWGRSYHTNNYGTGSGSGVKILD